MNSCSFSQYSNTNSGRLNTGAMAVAQIFFFALEGTERYISEDQLQLKVASLQMYMFFATWKDILASPHKFNELRPGLGVT